MNSPQTSHKRLWIFVGVFLFLVILLPIVLAMLPIWDGPPVDDADMHFEYREIPDEENAFELFRKAEAAMAERPRDWEQWNNWQKNPVAHAEEIREWIVLNDETLRLLREGIALGDYQTPELNRFSEEVPWVSATMEIGQLLRFGIVLGENPVRSEEMRLLLLRYADMNYRAGSGLIELLVGITLYESSIEGIFDTFYGTHTTEGELFRLLVALKETRLEPERPARAFQTEYRGAVLMIHEYMRDEGREGFEEHLPHPVLKLFSRPGAWVYQEENTKRLLLEPYRDIIAYLRGEGSFDQVLESQEIWKEVLNEGSSFHFLNAYFNLIGKMMLVMLNPADETVVNRYKITVAEHRAALLVCALNLYAREHGDLPESLEALVPDLLDAVPLDPFDEQAFRYLPDEGLVYSIGQNREDNGGSLRLRPDSRRDPTRNDSEDRVYGIFESIEIRKN